MDTLIRIAIVDPYDVVRDALKMVFEIYPDLHIVGATDSARQMLSLCETIKPDVVLFDFGSKNEDIVVIEQLHNRYPQVKVLVLTANSEAESKRKALQAGASGYLHITVSIGELRQAIVNTRKS